MWWGLSIKAGEMRSKRKHKDSDPRPTKYSLLIYYNDFIRNMIINFRVVKNADITVGFEDCVDNSNHVEENDVQKIKFEKINQHHVHEWQIPG